jgi:hypothetical protein
MALADGSYGLSFRQGRHTAGNWDLYLGSYIDDSQIGIMNYVWTPPLKTTANTASIIALKLVRHGLLNRRCYHCLRLLCEPPSPLTMAGCSRRSLHGPMDKVHN